MVLKSLIEDMQHIAKWKKNFKIRRKRKIVCCDEKSKEILLKDGYNKPNIVHGNGENFIIK